MALSSERFTRFWKSNEPSVSYRTTWTKEVRTKLSICIPTTENFESKILKFSRKKSCSSTPAGRLTGNPELATTAYGLFAFVICLSITLWTQNQIILRTKITPKGFKMMLDELLKMIATTPQLFGPLPFFLQRKKFQKFFEKWTSFQVNWRLSTLSMATAQRMQGTKKAEILSSVGFISGYLRRWPQAPGLRKLET